MAKIFKPRRGKKSTMAGTKKATVLSAGEMFIEVPDTGAGTGHSKMKIGDGSTKYSSLPYAMGDTENDKIAFSNDTSGNITTALNKVTSGAALKTMIAALKQAVSLANTSITQLNDETKEDIQRLDEQRYKVVHRSTFNLYVTEVNKEVSFYDELTSSLGKLSIENFLYIQFILRWEGMGNVQVNHTPTRYDAENSPVKTSNSYFDLGYGDNYIRAYVGYRWEDLLYVFNIYDIRGYNLTDLHLISITWCASKYLFQ